MNADSLCTTISDSLPALFECSPAPQEGARVRTPMMYPDGGIVDVFILARGDEYIVTDFGEALAWLRLQSTSTRRSRRQQILVEDVCQTLGLELFRGQLVLRAIRGDALAEAVIRISQAAVRVSDLWFTLRSRSVQTTADEVNEWLRENEIPFDTGVHHSGRSNSDWNVDFLTRTDERTTLMFLLSTGARGSARRIAEHVLSGFVDLSHLREDQPQLEFVSLFDDTYDVWREEEFALVESHSQVALWSRPDQLKLILRPDNRQSTPSASLR